MNWTIFSLTGYLSVALWLCVPVLWWMHQMIRPRRWLVHVAVGVALVALGLARANSDWHVSRLRVDQSKQVEDQLSRQALARQAAEEARSGEVAQVRFAEDAAGEHLDEAGMDDADLAYFKSIEEEQTPQWKQDKQQRDEGASSDADGLESKIGAEKISEGVEVKGLPQQADPEPILVSERDKTLADHLDSANLSIARTMVLLAIGVVVFDYMRRLNARDEAYFPLPVPSAWADALTPRPNVVTLTQNDRKRSWRDELNWIARRGEVFLLLTDDKASASQVVGEMPRLPGGLWPVRVLCVCDHELMDDGFVFEALWFGRGCFVVDTPERAEQLFHHTLNRLADRKRSRARTRRTVHVVWDIATRPSQADLDRFAATAGSTGFTLLVNPTQDRDEA
ncbi:MAG: hypothetical protein GC164_09690 [Phycisphaera sp.]|nr:hypothetical protein [Phycisphaera sp.]